MSVGWQASLQADRLASQLAMWLQILLATATGAIVGEEV